VQVGGGGLGEEAGDGFHRFRRALRASAAGAHSLDAGDVVKVFSFCY